MNLTFSSTHRTNARRAAVVIERCCCSWHAPVRAFPRPLAVNACDLRLDCPRSQVLLRGKGRKERIVPVPRDLVKALKALMHECGVDRQEARPLFVGTHGTRLTRFGATHIVRRAVAVARANTPELAFK